MNFDPQSILLNSCKNENFDDLYLQNEMQPEMQPQAGIYARSKSPHKMSPQI